MAHLKRGNDIHLWAVRPNSTTLYEQCSYCNIKFQEIANYFCIVVRHDLSERISIMNDVIDSHLTGI
jgi:hypothetical protein